MFEIQHELKNYILKNKEKIIKQVCENIGPSCLLSKYQSEGIGLDLWLARETDNETLGLKSQINQMKKISCVRSNLQQIYILQMHGTRQAPTSHNHSSTINVKYEQDCKTSLAAG